VSLTDGAADPTPEKKQGMGLGAFYHWIESVFSAAISWQARRTLSSGRHHRGMAAL